MPTAIPTLRPVCLCRRLRLPVLIVIAATLILPAQAQRCGFNGDERLFAKKFLSVCGPVVMANGEECQHECQNLIHHAITAGAPCTAALIETTGSAFTPESLCTLQKTCGATLRMGGIDCGDGVGAAPAAGDGDGDGAAGISAEGEAGSGPHATVTIPDADSETAGIQIATYDGKLIVTVTLVGVQAAELSSSNEQKAALIAGMADSLGTLPDRVSISSISSSTTEEGATKAGTTIVSLAVSVPSTTAEAMEIKVKAANAIATVEAASGIKEAAQQLGIDKDSNFGSHLAVDSITAEDGGSDGGGGGSGGGGGGSDSESGASNTMFVGLIALGVLVLFVGCVACRKGRSIQLNRPAAAAAGGNPGMGDATGQWLSDEPITKPNVSIL